MNLIRKIILVGLSLTTLLVSSCGSSDAETETTKRETVAAEAVADGDAVQDQEVSEDLGEVVIPNMPGATPEATAENFSHFSAVDVNGEAYDGSLLKGHRLNVINFWGTFCPPCIYEMPFLGNLNRTYDDADVQFIGVIVDTTDSANSYGEDTLAEAHRIIAESEADFIHLLPSPDLYTIFMNKVSSIPMTVFVDENGEIIENYVGAHDEAGWAELIDSALNKLD